MSDRHAVGPPRRPVPFWMAGPIFEQVRPEADWWDLRPWGDVIAEAARLSDREGSGRHLAGAQVAHATLKGYTGEALHDLVRHGRRPTFGRGRRDCAECRVNVKATGHYANPWLEVPAVQPQPRPTSWSR